MIEAKPLLDLAKCHKIYRKGELVCFLTWANYDDDTTEPCMVLLPKNGIKHRLHKPCVVALSSIYKYDDGQYAARISAAFADALGLTDSKGAFKVFDLIDNYIDELGQMPPKPEHGQYVAADAILTDENGKKRVFEITETK